MYYICLQKRICMCVCIQQIKNTSLVYDRFCHIKKRKRSKSTSQIDKICTSSFSSLHLEKNTSVTCETAARCQEDCIYIYI